MSIQSTGGTNPLVRQATAAAGTTAPPTTTPPMPDPPAVTGAMATDHSSVMHEMGHGLEAGTDAGLATGVKEASRQMALMELRKHADKAQPDAGKTWNVDVPADQDRNFGHHTKPVGEGGAESLMAFNGKGMVWADNGKTVTGEQWAAMSPEQQKRMIDALPPADRHAARQAMNQAAAGIGPDVAKIPSPSARAALRYDQGGATPAEEKSKAQEAEQPKAAAPTSAAAAPVDDSGLYGADQVAATKAAVAMRKRTGADRQAAIDALGRAMQAAPNDFRQEAFVESLKALGGKDQLRAALASGRYADWPALQTAMKNALE